MADTAPGNFVTTIALRTTPRDESILAKRFKAAHCAYNALLGEVLRRSRLMRESKAWRAAGKMPKGKDKTKAYRDLAVKFAFREYDLYGFIREQRRCWIGDHLDSRTMMSLAARAFGAVQRAIFTSGKARFRRFGEVRSIEGRSSLSPLRWSKGRVVWSGLKIAALIDETDPVVMHGVVSNVRLTRIVRMTVRGKVRYFAQLTSEGEAYRKAKNTTRPSVVGLDIGPSTIAIVGDHSATLNRFAGEVVDNQREVRQLQRRADRQVRANNPACFDEKGRWRKGVRAKVTTKRLRQTRERVAELHRRQAAHRKNQHGKLANAILRCGDDVRMEKLSYRAFRRSFGKSVGRCAPGMFVATLQRAAAKIGATVIEFSTRSTRLSQTCLCGTVRKKNSTNAKCRASSWNGLDVRTHHCDCGVTAQRDLFSAYLARYVREDRLDIGQAREDWPRFCNSVGVVSRCTERFKDRDTLRDHPDVEQGMRTVAPKGPTKAGQFCGEVCRPSDGEARGEAGGIGHHANVWALQEKFASVSAVPDVAECRPISGT